MRVHTDDKMCIGCEKKLNTAHPLLREWFHKIKSKFDVPGSGMKVHISWAYRGAEDQEQAFKDGKSNCRFPNSQHNKEDSANRPCSRAIDLFIIDADGLARWPYRIFKLIADEIKDWPLLWGGTFKLHNGNPDADHFQLLKEEDVEKWKTKNMSYSVNSKT